MVKKGKKKGKGGNSLEEVFGDAKQDGGGWQTSTAMLTDDEDAGPSKSKAPSEAGDLMDTSEGGNKASKKATSHVPGLGVVVHSMKRGDHTTKQKRRKVKKLVKAVARADKTGVRINKKETKKVSKLQRKNIY